MKAKPCAECGALYRAGLEPDPCLGWLPGVSQACCGHGDPKYAYVIIGGEPKQGVPSIPQALSLRKEAAVTFFELARAGELLTYGERVEEEDERAE